jgi:spermidine synthase
MKKLEKMALNIGVASIAFAVLLLELSLIRVMDVILAPNTGYMALTSAMFALGLGGIYLYLFHSKSDKSLKLVAFLSLLVSGWFNWLPFSLTINENNLSTQILAWAGMYIGLTLPFFIAGIVLSKVFQDYSKDIGRLYFFDLVGAGIACFLFIPLLPIYGPGGFLFVSAAAGVVAFLCFLRPSKPMIGVFSLIALGLLCTPLFVDDYIEFTGHADKRGNDTFIKDNKRVFVKWDPVSKLDVLEDVRPKALLFSLDGGEQSSWLKKLDGSLDQFVQIRETQPDTYFFGRNSIVHYLAHTAGKHPETLIIGASAGGEIRAALAFSPTSIDAVEMVGSIIEAERYTFKDYGGGLYAHPKVKAVAGEGRSYLRSIDKKYDIIQMFSNHSSSSIAQGSGAAGTVYLQTEEAYLEYFSHLKDDGILQINRHIYPRMLTTAAQAWERFGRKDFWKYALVLETTATDVDTLPTLLIKMTPWTQQEIDTVFQYVNRVSSNYVAKASPQIPSQKIYGGITFTAEILSRSQDIHGFEIRFGTYHQKKLPYNVTVQLKDSEGGETLASVTIDGSQIKDNELLSFDHTPIHNAKGKKLIYEISAPEASEENAISIWLDSKNNANITLLPVTYLPRISIVFHPLQTEQNLVPNRFLQTPFPYDEAKALPWDITPVTDYSPYFGMIRKQAKILNPSSDIMLDKNTAYLMNRQMQGGIPKDWMHLVVVAMVSVFFALIFLLLPILKTRKENHEWENMTGDIVYFACLGCGFILIEIVFIQLFSKLIGFPTHTLVVVISTMLVCAGIGSAYSKRLLEKSSSHTFIFAIIIAYLVAFVLTFEWLFYALLGLPLTGRILSAIMMIAPLAFLLGMPFPIGIMSLSGSSNYAVPWVWAINGFFTVLGGFLAIIISIVTSFAAVLLIAAAIYGIAMIVARSHSDRLKNEKFILASKAT